MGGWVVTGATNSNVKGMSESPVFDHEINSFLCQRVSKFVENFNLTVATRLAWLAPSVGLTFAKARNLLLGGDTTYHHLRL